MVTIRVLIVDDDQQFVEVLAQRLEILNLRVFRAFSGEQALEFIPKYEPDVVILDYLMPDRDGLETLKDIKSAYPLVEVIILTGHGSIQIAIQAMKDGAYDCLSKPTDTAELRDKITKAYQRRINRG